MINYFTWENFDESVEYIANKCKFSEFSGIYGVPRGGLCLAIALRHKLVIELNSKPKEKSLIVDDVHVILCIYNFYIVGLIKYLKYGFAYKTIPDQL